MAGKCGGRSGSAKYQKVLVRSSWHPHRLQNTLARAAQLPAPRPSPAAAPLLLLPPRRRRRPGPWPFAWPSAWRPSQPVGCSKGWAARKWREPNAYVPAVLETHDLGNARKERRATAGMATLIYALLPCRPADGTTCTHLVCRRLAARLLGRLELLLVLFKLLVHLAPPLLVHLLKLCS